jgi:hypothetical protein
MVPGTDLIGTHMRDLMTICAMSGFPFRIEPRILENGSTRLNYIWNPGNITQ